MISSNDQCNKYILPGISIFFSPFDVKIQKNINLKKNLWLKMEGYFCRIFLKLGYDHKIMMSMVYMECNSEIYFSAWIFRDCNPHCIQRLNFWHINDKNGSASLT